MGAVLVAEQFLPIWIINPGGHAMTRLGERRDMGKMSREKGKRFECEVAALFRDAGYSGARRSAQYCGNTGAAADVVGAPGIHIECKHQEKMELYNWMAQAVNDSTADSFGVNAPVVIHKQNRKPILCTMLFDDWILLYKAWEGLK